MAILLLVVGKKLLFLTCQSEGTKLLDEPEGVMVESFLLAYASVTCIEVGPIVSGGVEPAPSMRYFFPSTVSMVPDYETLSVFQPQLL